ncbi:hypothetical protein Psyaliredsea_26620 [Psychrobacter alimentarius]
MFYIRKMINIVLVFLINFVLKFIKSTFHTLYQPSIPLVSINASSLLKVVDIILVNEEVRKYKDKYFYKSVF